MLCLRTRVDHSPVLFSPLRERTSMMYLLWTAITLAFGSLFTMVVFSDKGRRSLVLALRSLWLHKMRAFLSVLGIIIGTLAVISLMAFGERSMQDALGEI